MVRLSLFVSVAMLVGLLFPRPALAWQRVEPARPPVCDPTVEAPVEVEAAGDRDAVVDSTDDALLTSPAPMSLFFGEFGEYDESRSLLEPVAELPSWETACDRGAAPLCDANASSSVAPPPVSMAARGEIRADPSCDAIAFLAALSPGGSEDPSNLAEPGFKAMTLPQFQRSAVARAWLDREIVSSPPTGRPHQEHRARIERPPILG